MRLFLFLLIWLFVTDIPAQNKGRQLKAGFGNYEAFNIGIRHSFERWSLEYGIGSDFNIYKQGYFNVIHASVGKRILKRTFFNDYQLFLNAKTLIWNIENKSNVFSAASFSTELLYKIVLNNQYQLGIYSGIVWSSVFRYKRKTYQEVGFPREWQPNFGLSLYYNLK